MSQTVKVSIGESALTWPTTIKRKDGVDISTATVTLGFGDIGAPSGTWKTPSTDTSPDKATRVVQMMVDNSFALGTYYLWVRIVTGAETILRRVGKVVVA